MKKEPFYPEYTSTLSAALTTTSTSLSIKTGTKQVCITNNSDTVLFVRISDSPVAATVNDFPILPKTQKVLSKFMDWGSVNLIWAATGTGNAYVTPGEGFPPGGF